MFLDNKDSARAQGDIGEARAIYEFTKMGYMVSIPTSVHCKYDLVVDDGERLLRVQVKTSQHQKKSGTFEVNLSQTSTKYMEGRIHQFQKVKRSRQFDILFVLTGDDNVWILPEDKIEGNFSILLNETGKYSQYKLGV